jgi:hypothetical protein
VARNLGCEPTKHFKQLSKGVSVTLDDGNIVTSEMVTEPALPAFCTESGKILNKCNIPQRSNVLHLEPNLQAVVYVKI